VVLSQTFPARPSWIPEIRDFVRRCLAESPLTEEGNREVGETVFRALLDAAGPTGAIQVSFRIFPEHVEVDVLHSNQPPAELVNRNVAVAPRAAAASAGPVSAPATAPAAMADDAGRPATFADWMSTALRREGLTQEAAARQLGVSVKTVGRWVGGETEPRLRDLRRIQELFGELPFS
jgi:DNA-binding XRE family transcriptional regulator